MTRAWAIIAAGLFAGLPGIILLAMSTVGSSHHD